MFLQMKRGKPVRVGVALGALVWLIACRGPTSPDKDGAQGSQTTSMSVSLPDRGPLASRVADIATKMNAYQIVVTPVDPKCPGATRLDTVAEYSSKASLDFKLVQGCDYEITLSLGSNAGPAAASVPAPAPAPGPAPTTSTPPVAAPAPTVSNLVTYDTHIKPLLAAKCVACHSDGTAKSGPRDLRSYKVVRERADSVVAKVLAGMMPPTSSASGTLQASERSQFEAWRSAGYPEKNSALSLTTTAASLSAVYYVNTTPYRVTKASIQGVSSLRANIKVQLTNEGKAIGL